MSASRIFRQALSDLEAREYATILDIANDAILVISLEGTIGFWNYGAERLYGWRRDEVLGRSAHEILQTVFPTPLAKINEVVVREGEWRGDLIHTRRDGVRVTVSSRWTGRYSKEGQLIGTFEVNRDVSDERRAHEALLQVEKLDRLASLGLLASSLAHEINNPLDAISGMVYLLARENLTREGSEHLATVKQELERVALIVRSTLSFSRQSPAAPSEARLSQLLDSAVAVYASRIRSKAVDVRKRYTTAGNCYCTGVQLRQVMANLIGNALDAMDSGGVLRLQLRKSLVGGKPGFRIVVSDTGHGISREVCAHMFEPFRSTKGELGTGLGLWISKNIVESSGGRLRFRTRVRPPRQGTSFFVEVPEEFVTSPASLFPVALQ